MDCFSCTISMNNRRPNCRRSGKAYSLVCIACEREDMLYMRGRQEGVYILEGLSIWRVTRRKT